FPFNFQVLGRPKDSTLIRTETTQEKKGTPKEEKSRAGDAEEEENSDLFTATTVPSPSLFPPQLPTSSFLVSGHCPPTVHLSCSPIRTRPWASFSPPTSADCPEIVAGDVMVLNGGMADSMSLGAVKESKLWKGVFAVGGIMSTLVIYGVLQEKIMRVPYGVNKEYFKYSLFLVFCNRVTTSAVSAISLVASKKALDPVAPVYKYCLISISNILTTTCQYEALKYVSFPVQTLAKCAKMIPVMIWGTFIMQKTYKGKDYLLAFLVTIGCSVFILFPAGTDLSPYSRGRENTVWGVSLMLGYLGFDGFTSTFQDKLFKGYEMEIHNQIFYTTLCSCFLSFTGLILQGHLLLAIDFIHRHHDCFLDVALLSTLVSILLSCVWFSHPLSWEQVIGSVSHCLFRTLFSLLCSRSCTNFSGGHFSRLSSLVLYTQRTCGKVHLQSLHRSSFQDLN
ncbi:unnamed protein product, partial [Linum tenue]